MYVSRVCIILNVSYYPIDFHCNDEKALDTNAVNDNFIFYVFKTFK